MLANDQSSLLMMLSGAMLAPTVFFGIVEMCDRISARVPREIFCFSSLIYTAGITLLVLLLSIELFWFAKAQDIWIDESTQLSGITLTLREMLHWLMGQDLDRFGVPGDRTPPISYALDWLWLRLANPSELSFRLFHSAFVIAGAIALVITALGHLGRSAATISLLFLITSPKLVQTGVEIRAYPIFFAITCAQVVVFLQLVPKLQSRVSDSKPVDIRLLGIFAGLCLVATYCHFYGVVSTCAFFLVLGIVHFRSSKSLTALSLVFAGLMIGSLGLLPFLTSALGQSSPDLMKEQSGRLYLTYFLRLIGDPANMVILPAAALFLGGASALLVSAAVPAFFRQCRRQARSCDWLALVASLGAIIPILASLIITRFNVLSPSYSGWILAPLTLLIGAGATSSTGFRAWDNAGRFAATSATLVGGLISIFFFLTHASMFVHGPQRLVGELFDGIESPKAVVYNGSTWGYSYFPLILSHGINIQQYRAAGNEVKLIELGEGGRANGGTPLDIGTVAASYAHLLIVDIRLRTYRDLRACHQFQGSCPRFARSETEEKLIGTGDWTESKVVRSFGLYDTQVKVFDRRADGCTPTPCR